jgi:hypothetical protein
MSFRFHHICLLFELLAFLIVLYRRFIVRDHTLTIFVVLLFLVNVVEWGNVFRLFKIGRSNNWVFNFFNPIQFGIYTLVFWKTFFSLTDRRKTLFFYALYIVLTAINIIAVQKLYYFDSYTFMLGCIMVVYFVYLYFRQSLRHPAPENLASQRMFWFAIGLLFFHTGDFILMSFFEYFLHINDFKSFQPVFYVFINILNIFFYTCLSISFFCKPTPPRPLSPA